MPRGRTPELLRHTRALMGLGARVGVASLAELLPIGALSALRALRTRAVAQIQPDMVWPSWLEAQLDPRSPAFVAPGELPLAANVTARDWTMIGNPGSPREAVVDPAGLVTLRADGWSLDWAVRSPDGPWIPARDPRLTQRLLNGAPVVETALPVARGFITHTACAVDGDRVLVEVHNRSNHPAGAVFAVRPYNPEGLAVVEQIELRGEAILVDGTAALWVEPAPDQGTCAPFLGADPMLLLARGQLPEERRAKVRDPAGLAQAAVIHELAPGATARAVMPLEPRRPRRRLRRPPGPARRERPADVVGRWERCLDRGMRVRLPDERLERAVQANRAYMLLFADGNGITPGPLTYHRFWFRDAAYELAALDRWGLHAEAGQVLESYPRRQRRDGHFRSQAAEWDTTGAAIWSIAEHHRLTHDAVAPALLDSVERGAAWIARIRRHSAGSETPGLLPAGLSAEHLGPPDQYYWDDFWALRGLLDAADLLAGHGRLEPAQAAAREADALRGAIGDSLEAARARLKAQLMPAGPRRGVDAGMIGSLAACWPLGLMSADDPWVVGTLEAIRSRFLVGDAFFHAVQHAGLGTYLTMQIAQVELEAGDARAWRRLRWLLDAATPTFTWPEAIHPQLTGGCMGDGHHGWAAADFLSFVRAMLVRETPSGELALLSVLPDEWRGRPLEVSDAPTHRGMVSFSVDWRGKQARLRWECAGEDVRLTAPGLDAGWSGSGRAGEVWLG